MGNCWSTSSLRGRITPGIGPSRAARRGSHRSRLESARGAATATVLKTQIVSASADDAVNRAVELLRRGEIVALPTETVYGLAADALNEAAVPKIFEAKSRPRFDPLIVHLPETDWIGRVAVVDDSERSLFDELRNHFWPGPLTFVFPRQPIISDVVTAGLQTVAVRLSSHPVFAEIARPFGRPLAAPSANRFGRISPTTGAHVVEELDGLI